MEVSVSDAKAQLTDLVRRAEAGEEIVLTRHGQATARIVPMTQPKPSREERARLLAEIVASAHAKLRPGPSGKELQDALYDEFGLPK